MSARTTLLCTFYLNGSLFGIEVESVQEIIRHQDLTAIPLAPDEVAGLMNLRGQIVPAIELRSCLQLPSRRDDELPTNVVISTDDGAVSLLIDQIGDVVEVGVDAFEPPPDNLRGAMRALIRGVCRVDRDLLLVLATDAVITAATSSMQAVDDSGASRSSFAN